MGSTRHHPLLAGYNQFGKPWVNPEVKKKLGVNVHNKIMRHQRVFLQKLKKGKSWNAARKAALKAEHKGMTKKQMQTYEGKLGALERKLKGRRNG